MLENVNCNLCGADNTILLFKANGFNIVKCKSCSLTYVNPRFRGEQLEDIYSSETYYTGKAPDTRSLDYFSMLDELRHGATDRINKIMRYKSGGKFLDVGCALGYQLEIARNYGWECYGVELSTFAANYVREKLNINVFCGTLEQANYPEKSFDVITMYHIIEHLPDPTATLSYCQKLLKPDGILVVEVPDFGSAQAQRLKENWQHIVPEQHIYCFTKNSLTKLLRKTGFKPIKIFLRGGTGLLCPSGQKKADNARGFIIRHMKYFKWIRAVMRYIYLNLLKKNDHIAIFSANSGQPKSKL